MPRDIGLYLEDMIEAGMRIASYTAGMGFATFSGDPRTIDAVVRNLEILGEAAKRVPDEVRRRSSDIDWRKIAGMREVLAHTYFEIDLEIVWDAATQKVPGLMGPLRGLLDAVGSA